MSSETGLNETASLATIEQIIEPDAVVRLLNDNPDYDDTATEISEKEVDGDGYTAQTVVRDDWDVSFDPTAGTATLSNVDRIMFGTVDDSWGTIEAAVIQSDTDADKFIRVDEPENPDPVTGAAVSYAPDDLEYKLGDS